MSIVFYTPALAFIAFVGTITDRVRVVPELLCEGNEGCVQL